MGLAWVIGDVSVRPYPSTSLAPVIDSNFSATARGSGAAPERHARIDVRSYFGVSFPSLMAMYSRGTPGNIVGFSFWITFSVGSSWNWGIRTSFAALYTPTFIATV